MGQAEPSGPSTCETMRIPTFNLIFFRRWLVAWSPAECAAQVAAGLIAELDGVHADAVLALFLPAAAGLFDIALVENA